MKRAHKRDWLTISVRVLAVETGRVGALDSPKSTEFHLCLISCAGPKTGPNSSR